MQKKIYFCIWKISFSDIVLFKDLKISGCRRVFKIRKEPMRTAVPCGSSTQGRRAASEVRKEKPETP